MERRGYTSHFKYTIGACGEEIKEPRKRLTDPNVANAICDKMKKNGMDVVAYYCSYCNGYHIGKK
jgi:hypothetical protein